MLKASLRISAALAIAFAIALVALLYVPVWSEFGKLMVDALGGDKVVHGAVGALLPLSLAFLARLYLASKRLQWAFWCACLLVFAGDEFVQGFSAQRASDLSDFMMSGLGWLIGCSFWWLIWLFRRPRD
jgi:hypothetical protein